MATAAPCPSYVNLAFVSDQGGKKISAACSLVIANGSQNSENSPSEPLASRTNEAAESGLHDETSSSNNSGKVSDFFPVHVLFPFLCNIQQYCDSEYNKLNSHKQKEFINITQLYWEQK